MKPIHYLFFLNSCITAFCLCLVVYVLTTGDIPFNIQPLLAMPPQQPREEPKPTAEELWRAPELQAEALLENLEAERQRLAAEKEKLADERRAASELMRHAEELQKRTRATQTKALDLLDLIDKQERTNLENAATLLANSDAKAAASILSEMPIPEAARIIYCMSPRKASELLTAITKQGPQGAGIASRITQHLQRVADESLFETKPEEAKSL